MKCLKIILVIITLIGMCIFCKPGEEGEIIGTIRSDDRGGPENFEVLLI